MSKFTFREWVVTAAILAVPTAGAPLMAAELPEEISVRGQFLATSVSAAGAQVYECKPTARGELVWQFREPVATLFINGKTVGRHYAGPIWEMTDGSTVSARTSGRTPGANEDDIPWLRLDVTSSSGTGQLAGITAIQRLDTRGGAADGPCDAAGKILSVPYEAVYAFYRLDAAATSEPAPGVRRPVQASRQPYVANPVFIAPRPAVGVIIVRGDDRDRRPRKKRGGPKSPPSKSPPSKSPPTPPTAEPKSPPSKPTPPTAEPKSPPIVPNRTVRDHRTPKPAPVVRDHRAPKPAPEVRDHRAQPKVRDHRNSASASDDKPGGGASPAGKPPAGPKAGSGSKPICGFSGTPPCVPK